MDGAGEGKAAGRPCRRAPSGEDEQQPPRLLRLWSCSQLGTHRHSPASGLLIRRETKCIMSPSNEEVTKLLGTLGISERGVQCLLARCWGGRSTRRPAGAQALVLPGTGLAGQPEWPNPPDGLQTPAAAVPPAVTPRESGWRAPVRRQANSAAEGFSFPDSSEPEIGFRSPFLQKTAGKTLPLSCRTVTQ